MKKPTPAPTLGRSAKPVDDDSHGRKWLTRGDRYMMTCIYRTYRHRLDGGNSLSLDEQGFLVDILLAAAENPRNAARELGVAKGTKGVYRDRLIAVYLYRLAKQNGMDGKHGTVAKVLREASKNTGIKIGVLRASFNRAEKEYFPDEYRKKPVSGSLPRQDRKRFYEVNAEVDESCGYPMSNYVELLKQLF